LTDTLYIHISPTVTDGLNKSRYVYEHVFVPA